MAQIDNCSVPEILWRAEERREKSEKIEERREERRVRRGKREENEEREKEPPLCPPPPGPKCNQLGGWPQAVCRIPNTRRN